MGPYPALTFTSLTTPSIVDTIGISIFIDSNTASSSPASTWAHRTMNLRHCAGHLGAERESASLAASMNHRVGVVTGPLDL